MGSGAIATLCNYSEWVEEEDYERNKERKIW
jgi:hypothetical protein